MPANDPPAAAARASTPAHRPKSTTQTIQQTATRTSRRARGMAGSSEYRSSILGDHGYATPAPMPIMDELERIKTMSELTVRAENPSLARVDSTRDRSATGYSDRPSITNAVGPWL